MSPAVSRWSHAGIALVLIAGLAGCPDEADYSFDFDGDGWDDEQDCEPEDPNVHPQATEDCADGVDNDCDGLTDVEDGACDPGDDDSSE